MIPQAIDAAVRSLQGFDVEDVASDKFLSISLRLEELAFALSTDSQSVVQAVRIHGSFRILVQNLLAVELWRSRVLPLIDIEQRKLKSELTNNRLRIAFVLHMETTMLNLLNAIMIDFCCDIDGDCMLALIDYCARCMVNLLHPNGNSLKLPEKDARSMEAEAPFRSCVFAATSLVRTICENIATAHLSAQSRVLNKHDYLLLLVALVNEPPWTRKRENAWEKFNGSKWETVDVKDLLTLTPNEGQIWLAIFYLTCQECCQKTYRLTLERKETLLKLKPFVGSLKAQLYVLDQLANYLEQLGELSILDERSPMLLEEADLIRLALTKNKDWENIAHKQVISIFSKITDANDELLHQWGLLHVSVTNSELPCNNKPVSTNTFDVSSVSSILLELKNNATETLKVELSLVGGMDKCDRAGSVDIVRRKLKFQEMSQFAHPDSSAFVTIDYTSGCNRDTLECEDLELPRPILGVLEVGSQFEVPKSIPSRIWRQLGLIENGIVLQVGFKVQSKGYVSDDGSLCCYRMDKCVLSYRDACRKTKL